MKFKKGDALPDWLTDNPGHFGVDAVVEERDDGRVWIYPVAEIVTDDYLVGFKDPVPPVFKRAVTVWKEPKA